MTASPKEVVRRYIQDLWDQENADLLHELVAEKCWRHDTYDVENQLICVTLEEQIERVKDGFNVGKWEFPIIKLLEDGPYCTLIYDCILTAKSQELFDQLVEKYDAVVDAQGRMRVKGIEVFKVVGGKIVEIWNAQHFTLRGSWGEEQT